MKNKIVLPGLAVLLAVLLFPAATLAVGCTLPASQNSNLKSLVASASAVTGENNVVVRWMSNEPTTTSLWYSPDPSDPSYMVGYSNPFQGFTTSHMITVAGMVPEWTTLLQLGGMDESGSTVMSAAVPFSTLFARGIVPLITVSGISDGNATVNVNANAPVKAELTYGIAGQPATYSMYSSSSYSDYNPIYLTNLANSSNYQGQITVYDENGNTIGTYPVSWMTFQ